MYSPVGPKFPPFDGEGFNFPFTPYKTQLKLMRRLYGLVEDGVVGLVESPTGTGKSLTLTCSVLTWLEHHEALVNSELEKRIEESEAIVANPQHVFNEKHNWFFEQSMQMENRDKLAEMKKVKILKDEYDKRLRTLKEKTAKITAKKKFNRVEKTTDHNELEDGDKLEEPVDDFIMDDCEEDENGDDVPCEDDQPKYKPVQIIFSSRTHSQLGQVVNEVRRTKFAERIRVNVLASRQNLCINKDVMKLGSNALINERCLELQKTSTKSIIIDGDKNARKKRKVAEKCPFYNREAIEELTNDSLFKVQDIEDLVASGKQLKACPYYASRAAIPDSQLLMVPYQMLLHKKTREQTGIDIKNSVIIIDEAHNLLDTIMNIHSHEVTLEQLQKARLQINAYKTRYSSMLSAANLLKINQILFIVTRLCKLLETQPNPQATHRMIKNDDLKIEGNFLNMNLRDILHFAEKMRIAQKIHGFALSSSHQLISEPREKSSNKSRTPTSTLKSYLKQLEHVAAGKGAKEEATVEKNELQNSVEKKDPVVNVIRPLLAFLECLEDDAEDGRVLLSYGNDPKKSSMRYLLISPGSKFDLHKHCRSLILAGGTMQPTDEFVLHLFIVHPRVATCLYPHVAPEEAILPLAIAKGPSGRELRFDFNNRKKQETLKELSSTLFNICQVVPNGVVCFFSSYDYLDYVFSYMQKSGELARLAERKSIHREHRAGLHSDNVLAEYSKMARQCTGTKTGAFMFSVVGGKFSEGLNFSDELGRCVIVVGLPYPNREDPVLAERMRFMNENVGFEPESGDMYYQNLCMRAVNQCIGRAIRHVNDYASVILLDVRYAVRTSVNTRLPEFVKKRLQIPSNYGNAHASLAKFFKRRAPK